MAQTKTHRELQFENEHVCVWKTVVFPDQSPPETDGKQVIIDLTTHKANWLKIESPQKGKEPVEIMIVEMKQAKDRPFPSIPLD